MQLSSPTILRGRRLYAFGLRHIYPLKRDFDLLSDMLYWPVIDVVVWGVTSQWLSNGTGASLAATILTGLILWNIIWRSQSEISRNLIDEIWNNNLVNLFSTPLTVSEWITGVLTLSLIKMTFTISVLSSIILYFLTNIFVMSGEVRHAKFVGVKYASLLFISSFQSVTS